jgi:2'-5' RNA ligase
MEHDVLRTFFGFALQKEVSQRAANLRTLVDDPKGAVRWVKGVNIHLTVRFLGATPRIIVDEIISTMPEKLAGCSPFTVKLEGTGVFPSPTRPRVLWMGISGEISRLQELEFMIHEVVGPKGFPREDREFRPHITLGRVRYPQKIIPDVSRYLNADYEPVVCPMKELHLYQSLLEPGGARYISLAKFPLLVE